MERTTFTYGGGGGSPFPANSPHSVGLRSGDMVDAIIINDQHYGGNGGGNPTIQTLGPDEYWSAFTIRSGDKIDHLKLVSSSQRVVEGGGGGGSQDSHDTLRIISIAGRCGDLVDQLAWTSSSLQAVNSEESNVEVVLDVRTGGQTIKHFTNQTVRTAHSYQLVTQKKCGMDVNASAEGEYFAKFSASTSYKTSDSGTQSIQDESSQAVETGDSAPSRRSPRTRRLSLSAGWTSWPIPAATAGWSRPPTPTGACCRTTVSAISCSGEYDLTVGAATQAGLTVEEEDTDTGFYKLKKA